MQPLGYRLGLPMWAHAPWKGCFFTQSAQQSDFLEQYTSVFNTVEGNTTFYSFPSEHAVAAWAEAAPADFRFSFKLPKLITHDLKLERCELSVTRFFESIDLISDRCGPFMIQLPPGFTGEDLPVLANFIKTLPACFNYAVEVRHSDFFDVKGYESELNQLLEKYKLDRVCFDSRALFSSQDQSPETRDAKKKKPNFPVHAIGISRYPVVRYVGHEDPEENETYFKDWVRKLQQWLQAGKEPYVFIHLADNTQAPQLAWKLHQLIQSQIPQIPDLPKWPVENASLEGQIGLF